jgi:hypothetical protein
MKNLNRIGVALLIFSVIGCGLGNAQETVDSFSSINLSALAGENGVLALSGTNIASFSLWSDDQLTTLVNALDATPTISASDLPRRGMGLTCWSLQNPKMPPLPGDTIGVSVWQLSDGSFLLNDANYDYNAASTSDSMQMSAMDSGLSGPPGFGDTNTNYIPDSITNGIPVDYGTNLWIAETAVAGGNVSGIISNTTAEVQMELQYTFSLTQPWQSANPNWFVSGSELTNWTAWSVPAISSSNLFLRVRSWGSDDGSGLPTWWETLYFGTNSIDGNAQDSASDGWTIYQKFAMGINPATFVTPPTPQGFTVTFNPNTKIATLNWLPSPGNLINYTVEKSYAPDMYSPTQITDYNTNATTYFDSLATNTPDPFNGNIYYVSYRIRANYPGGSSAWSASLPVQQVTASAAIIPGTNGATYLAVWGLPANATTVRLEFIDQLLNSSGNHDPSFDYSNNIPVSMFTNGIYQLSAAFYPPATDSQGPANYGVFIQTVDAEGDASEATVFDSAYGWPTEYNWGLPFYDGRVQLKQNLIFQLRTAPADGSLQFGYEGDPLSYPTNYAVASVYQYADTYAEDYGLFDALLPFEENYLFRNFVFSITNVDANGNLTTGVSAGTGYPDYYDLSDPTFLYYTNLIPSQTLLSTNNTRWLTYDQSSGSDDVNSLGIVNTTVGGNGETTISMPTGSYNWFGLRYLSIAVVGTSATTGNLVNNTVSAGHALTSWDFSNPYNIYTETVQPQFTMTEYDFWNTASPLPGNPSFSPTNGSQLLITSVANDDFIVAGYAKLAVNNSVFGNRFAYLGQYFSQAYQVDANGNVTTNTTGVLSPYGNFFSTQAGQAALVTMPDVDTGARGTCMVYSVSLQLDANHDGKMDLSFNGPDTTSSGSPFVFWANNNFDRWNYDTLSLMYEQDDLQIAFSPASPKTITPDCNYSNVLANGYAYRAIPCTRDLEDFARLWVCGVTTNLLAALPAGSTVTLSWGDVGSPNSANPTIDLFTAADPNGGIGYQTNETVAAQQTNSITSPYIGRLGPGQSIQLNANQFANNWAGNYFIWCGVNNGSGGLTLTIADGSGNTLAQATSYIQIVDIKQLYERWTVGDKPSVAPLTNAVLTTEGLAAGESPFKYPTNTVANVPYILHVHGYNMQPWEKDSFAETAYKRLYWQGYQGRFGAFNWPTAEHALQFGSSEGQAWNSAQGLLNKLNGLNAIYPGQVYLTAHSLGNIAAGEALRLAGSTHIANTYVAMQGAVTAHAYDPTTIIYNLVHNEGIPDYYANYWTSGAPCYFSASAGAGAYVNFYNTNDWALNNAWILFQNAKPDLYPSYSYQSPNLFYKNFGFTELFFPTNTYELFNCLIQTHSYAIGMQPNVGGTFKTGITYHQLELDVPPYNFGTQHIYHSGEFRSDNPQRWQFWDEVLFQMGLKTSL